MNVRTGRRSGRPLRGLLDGGPATPSFREGGAIPPPDVEPLVGPQEPAVVPDLAFVVLRVDDEHACRSGDDVVEVPLGDANAAVVQHLEAVERLSQLLLAVGANGPCPR